MSSTANCLNSYLIFEQEDIINTNNNNNNNALLCSLTGFILKFPIWGDPADDNCFDDEAYWEVMALFFHQMAVLSS